jgi:hypothetical protein
LTIIRPKKASTPLKLCARFNRDEVLGSPNIVINGLAAVSKKVRPPASINKGSRKKEKLAFCAEG